MCQDMLQFFKVIEERQESNTLTQLVQSVEAPVRKQDARETKSVARTVGSSETQARPANVAPQRPVSQSATVTQHLRPVYVQLFHNGICHFSLDKGKYNETSTSPTLITRFTTY